MLPISQLDPHIAQGIRYVLMDIDDTLTQRGKLLDSSYTALWRLHKAGLVVIPVTGRPAGWCDLIARQWPVDAVIGENGALVFWEEPATQPGGIPVLKQRFHPEAVRNNDGRLSLIQERVLQLDSRLRLAKDQPYRLFDVAIDFAEEEPVLPLELAVQAADLAKSLGGRAKVSSIHVNIWMGTYDKLSMAELFLLEQFRWDPLRERQQVLFVGDSPNDEPMFAAFLHSCAVANITKYTHLIKQPPAYVSNADCGDGFAEIVDRLLVLRSEQGTY